MRIRWSRRSVAPIYLIVIVAAIQPSACLADWLYFARGGQVQVPVERSNGRFVVETRAGRYLFQEQDFRRIIPGGGPEQEWAERSKLARRGGGAERFAAAWWALENGLVPETIAMLREAHEADPEHQPTARLVDLIERLERPCRDPEIDRLRSAIGVVCEEESGPHVLLLHQHDQTEARARIDLLERVTTSYYLVLAAAGIDLEVPSRRLVSVYLRDHSDYLRFLETQGAAAFRSTLGYYHPNFRAVLTFDPRQWGVPRADRVEKLGDFNRRGLLSDLDAQARADGTAAHEMVHLLVNESGLAADPGVFPLWLHEGFAAQFEVIRGGRWAGVGRAHDLRLPDWRAVTVPAALEPLIGDGGFGHGYRRDLYAKSWALVYFLRKTRHREFTTFLELLRVPDPELAIGSPDRFRKVFQAAFGSDLNALELEWRAYLGSIHTPLEEHDQDNGLARSADARRLPISSSESLDILGRQVKGQPDRKP